MASVATAFSRGVAASRPGVLSCPIGSLYYSTDIGITERNNGSTWDVFSGFGLIQEQLLVGDVASVTFTLPATTPYRHLRLVCYGRVTEATTDNYIYLQFNADTAANYDHQQLTSNQTAPASAVLYAQTKIRLGEFAGATAAAASNAGSFEVLIPHYAGVTFDKHTIASGGGAWGTATTGIITMHTYGRWRSAAAITSIVLSPSANNFKTGSIFSLYGML